MWASIKDNIHIYFSSPNFFKRYKIIQSNNYNTELLDYKICRCHICENNNTKEESYAVILEKVFYILPILS